MSYLYNPFQSDVHLSQDSFDVLTALLRFVRDAAFNKGTRLVGGNLTRDEDLGPGDYSLGLRRALANLSSMHACAALHIWACVVRKTYVWWESCKPNRQP